MQYIFENGLCKKLCVVNCDKRNQKSRGKGSKLLDIGDYITDRCATNYEGL